MYVYLLVRPPSKVAPLVLHHELGRPRGEDGKVLSRLDCLDLKGVEKSRGVASRRLDVCFLYIYQHHELEHGAARAVWHVDVTSEGVEWHTKSLEAAATLCTQ